MTLLTAIAVFLGIMLSLILLVWLATIVYGYRRVRAVNKKVDKVLEDIINNSGDKLK